MWFRLTVALGAAALCPLAAQNLVPVTVSGKVVNAAGQPLSKANVTLRQTGPAPTPTYAAVSGPDGTFEITGAPPGTYFMYAERTGYMPQAYNAKPGVQFPTGSRSSMVLVAGQSISDRDIQMVPATTLSGKVLDEDGDPVAGAQVRVLRRVTAFGGSRLFQASVFTTDPAGEYRFVNLPPGKYLLAAAPRSFDQVQRAAHKEGKQETTYIETWYPGTTNRNAAANVEAFAGRDQGGMHIPLKKAAVYHVRGRVDGASGNASLRVYAAAEETVFLSFAGGAGVKEDGSFDLQNVPAGTHAVLVLDQGDGGRNVARRLVTVNNDDVNDFVLQVLPPIVIQGRIQMEGDEPAPDPANPTRPAPFRLSLGMKEGLQSNGIGNIKVAEDGTFVLPRLNPGKYVLLVSGGPADGYWKSTKRGELELESNVLDVSDGNSQPVDIVWARNGSTVTGMASTGQGAPTVSGVYLLIPDSDELADAQIIKSGVIPAGGQFTIRGVRPGTWQLFAVEENDGSGTLSPSQLKKALTGRGTTVVVKEKETVQASVAIVFAADVERLAAEVQQ